MRASIGDMNNLDFECHCNVLLAFGIVSIKRCFLESLCPIEENWQNNSRRIQSKSNICIQSTATSVCDLGSSNSQNGDHQNAASVTMAMIITDSEVGSDSQDESRVSLPDGVYTDEMGLRRSKLSVAMDVLASCGNTSPACPW